MPVVHYEFCWFLWSCSSGLGVISFCGVIWRSASCFSFSSLVPSRCSSCMKVLPWRDGRMEGQGRQMGQLGSFGWHMELAYEGVLMLVDLPVPN